MKRVRVSGSQQGSALIAVLWLTAAMAVITFAVAATVRTETERVQADSEGVRTYYVARGSIDRALLWIRWGAQYRRPDGGPMFFESPMPRLEFKFPSGVSVVELIPESAKYNVNTMTPENLYRLLSAMGVEAGRAQLLTAGILDWRGAPSAPGQSNFDRFYSAQPSSFHAPHASIHELEELLLVRGMTPDLFYGNYTRDPEGHAVWQPGLRDCLSTLGSDYGFDINTVEPVILASLGVPPAAINQIAAIRRRRAIKSMDEVSSMLPSSAAGHLRIGGGSIITVRATARLFLPNGQLSDLKRSVSALVKLENPGQEPAYTILRWYDNAQSSVL